MMCQLVRNMFRQKEDEEEKAAAAEGRSHLQTNNYNMTVQRTVLINESILHFFLKRLYKPNDMVSLLFVSY